MISNFFVLTLRQVAHSHQYDFYVYEKTVSAQTKHATAGTISLNPFEKMINYRKVAFHAKDI